MGSERSNCLSSCKKSSDFRQRLKGKTCFAGIEEYKLEQGLNFTAEPKNFWCHESPSSNLPHCHHRIQSRGIWLSWRGPILQCTAWSWTSGRRSNNGGGTVG